MSRFYRRDGTTYKGRNAVLDWGRDMKNHKNKIVKQEKLKNGLWVSTVWLGIDHNWGYGKPLIFETMVFKNRKDLSEIDMERFSTEKEAIAGHQRFVKKWSNKKNL